jgi:hypothetical protein
MMNYKLGILKWETKIGKNLRKKFRFNPLNPHYLHA